jgi:AraC-like DNA-binding protein
VLAIALDSGFGDLSTFNHRFRATFGATPTQYRASQL